MSVTDPSGFIPNDGNRWGTKDGGRGGNDGTPTPTPVDSSDDDTSNYDDHDGANASWGGFGVEHQIADGNWNTSFGTLSKAMEHAIDAGAVEVLEMLADEIIDNHAMLVSRINSLPRYVTPRLTITDLQTLADYKNMEFRSDQDQFGFFTKMSRLADTSFYKLFPSKKFKIGKKLYSGGSVNYIGVGVCGAAYGIDPVTMITLVVDWNLSQYFGFNNNFEKNMFGFDPDTAGQMHNLTGIPGHLGMMGFGYMHGFE